MAPDAWRCECGYTNIGAKTCLVCRRPRTAVPVVPESEIELEVEPEVEPMAEPAAPTPRPLKAKPRTAKR